VAAPGFARREHAQTRLHAVGLTGQCICDAGGALEHAGSGWQEVDGCFAEVGRGGEPYLALLRQHGELRLQIGEVSKREACRDALAELRRSAKVQPSHHWHCLAVRRPDFLGGHQQLDLFRHGCERDPHADTERRMRTRRVIDLDRHGETLLVQAPRRRYP